MKLKINEIKKIILLSFSTVLATISFAQDWNTIHSFSPDQTTQSIAIGHGDTLMACSALYNGTALNIKRTDDNGVTWSEQYTGYTSQNFRRMATSDSVNFFAIANTGILIGNWGTDEWTTITMPTTSHLRDIFFYNNDLGYITADAGLIFKTIDGGATWTEMVTVGAGGGSINTIYFTTETTGFIAGFNFFRRTTDGGVTWSDITGFVAEHPSYQLQEIDFLNPNVGYVCGDIGYIYKSTDGGLNWVKQTTGTEESIQGIDMISENKGFACGYAATTLGTNDGGTTWFNMTNDQTENFRAIQFNSKGGFIVTHLGNVLYYELPGAGLNKDDDAIAIHLYPNPTSDFISIDFTGTEQLFSLTIYNLQGELVLDLSASKNETLDISNLVNGTYFVKCTTEYGVYTKKLIKTTSF